MANVGVLGAGAFGSALANLLGRNGHNVLIWAKEPGVCRSINKTKKNPKFLRKIPVHDNVQATTEISELLAHAQIIAQAVPILYLREVFEQVREHSNASHRFVSATKGLEDKTLMLPAQVIEHILGPEAQVAAIGGPDFAKDLAEGTLCTANIASKNEKALAQLSEVFAGPTFKVVPTDDLVGVQILGALKNANSFALSVLRGTGVSPSQEAYFFGIALNEMLSMLKAVDGQAKTMFEPAGIADFVLTLHGIESRNVRFGTRVGQGQDPREALKGFDAPPEGFATLAPMVKLAEKLKVQCSIVGLAKELMCGEINLAKLKTRANKL